MSERARSYEEAFERFIMDLEKLSGVRDGVTKIGLDPQLMDQLVYALLEKSKYRFSPSHMGELNLFGVQIVARARDNF